MAWAAFVAGTAISAGAAIYQANAIAGGNELKKRQTKLSARQSQIAATAEQNDRLEMLEYVNSEAVTKFMAQGGFVDSSPSFAAVLNENVRKTERDVNLLELNKQAIGASEAMELRALDYSSKTAKMTGYLNASGTVLRSWGMKSLLGGTSNLSQAGRDVDELVETSGLF